MVETTADAEEVVEWLIEQPNNAVVDGTATVHDGQFATLTLELTHADGISEATIESIASEVRQGVSLTQTAGAGTMILKSDAPHQFAS